MVSFGKFIIRKISMSDIIFGVIYMLMALICLSGVTVFSRYYLQLMMAVVLLSLIVIRVGVISLRSSSIYIAWIVCTLLSLIVSLDVFGTLNYCLIYIFGFFLFTFFWPLKRITGLINIFLIVCVFLVITQFIEVINNNFIIDKFSFLFGQGNIDTMIHDMRFGIYRGLSGERSEAAYVFVIGLVICLSKIMPFVQSSKKIPLVYIFLSFLFICGVMLTGKRMLFAVAILIFAIFFFLGKRGISAKFKMVLLLICLLAVLIIATTVIPSLSVVFDRFYETGSNVLNGREDLWKYAFQMINDTVLMGSGYGSYNTFISEYFGYTWSYHAHNVYVQVFGEMGIVGFFVWLLFVFSMLKNSISLVKTSDTIYCKDDCVSIWFSFGIQVVTLIYGISGNVFYYPRQLVLYLLAVAFANMIRMKGSGLTYDSKYKCYRTSLQQ